MAIALSLLVATPAFAVTYPVCSWDKPGVDPYMGDLPKAIDDYQDIPILTRERLKARMRDRDYNEIVIIRRDSIDGRGKYDPEITDMHFGKPIPPKVCKRVVRNKWVASESQMGMVYCQDHYCILIPFICRNVSRIVKSDEAVAEPQHVEDEGLPAMPPLQPFISGNSSAITQGQQRTPLDPINPYHGYDSYPQHYGDIQPPTPVDEPSTLWLFAIGAACYFIKRSRDRD